MPPPVFPGEGLARNSRRQDRGIFRITQLEASDSLRSVREGSREEGSEEVDGDRNVVWSRVS